MRELKIIQKRVQSHIHVDQIGNNRSPLWAETRREYLKKYPTCAICGSIKYVEVHHIIPFHIAPDRELDHSNLISLCEGYDNCNCHLVFGHFSNYKLWNPEVARIAKYMKEGIVFNKVPSQL